MKAVDTATQVLKEVQKATKKFPTWPTDPLHALAVLGEEFGELTKAVLQFTYEPHKATLDDIRTEAIQTAAMALRFVMSLDKYDYDKAEQHSQGSEGDRFIGMTYEELQEKVWRKHNGESATRAERSE